jgi:hypothetical protein
MVTTPIDAAVDQAVDLVAQALWQRDGFLSDDYADKASVYRHAVRTALARPVAGPAGQPCPHIVTTDEGTSHCTLAERTHTPDE